MLRTSSFILSSVVFISFILAVEGGGVCPYWSYSGEHGPNYWGALCVNWRICGRGKEQSPVDIRNALKASSALGPLFYRYAHTNSSKTKMEYNGNNVEIKWNHQGEIFKGPFGNERTFLLNVIFFHTPSEHFITGQQMPLEMQLIHLSDDGYMAVLSILFEYGRSNPILAGIVPHLTNATDTEVEIPSPNLNLLLKEAMTDGYYFYQGSLTSPPCTQGISWVVARKVVKAAANEIDAFVPILKNNIRPIQTIGERYILEYIPFGGVDTFIFDEKSWYIKALVAFVLVLLLSFTMFLIYACDFVLRPFMYPKKKDYTEIL